LSINALRHFKKRDGMTVMNYSKILVSLNIILLIIFSVMAILDLVNESKLSTSTLLVLIVSTQLSFISFATKDKL